MCLIARSPLWIRRAADRVALDLTGVPYMTLWSDGGPFLCVEPCWGLTDHDEQRAFEDKEGIQTDRARWRIARVLSRCSRESWRTA